MLGHLSPSASQSLDLLAFSETGSNCIILAGLKLTMQIKLTSNLVSSAFPELQRLGSGTGDSEAQAPPIQGFHLS